MTFRSCRSALTALRHYSSGPSGQFPCSQCVTIICFQGAQGDPGDQGQTGEPGMAGQFGAPGLRGMQGTKGSRGMPGRFGLKGMQVSGQQSFCAW